MGVRVNELPVISNDEDGVFWVELYVGESCPLLLSNHLSANLLVFVHTQVKNVHLHQNKIK